jgi:hypothetical protein
MTKLRRTKQNIRVLGGGACCDCGMETMPQGRKPGTHEQFIVKDEIWAAAGMKLGKRNPKTHELVGGGFLCVGCFEKRLGRRLSAADINPITLGHLLSTPWATERLRSRILYPDQASEDAAKTLPPIKWTAVLGKDGIDYAIDLDLAPETDTRLA